VSTDISKRSPTVNNIMELHSGTLRILRKAIKDLDGHWMSLVEVGLPRVDDLLTDVSAMMT
jgi:hypothetical protein